jgi:hypothetical protein
MKVEIGRLTDRIRLLNHKLDRVPAVERFAPPLSGLESVKVCPISVGMSSTFCWSSGISRRRISVLRRLPKSEHGKWRWPQGRPPAPPPPPHAFF